MSEARGANSDPSMDDILASIRKIISDDEARAKADALKIYDEVMRLHGGEVGEIAVIGRSRCSRPSIVAPTG